MAQLRTVDRSAAGALDDLLARARQDSAEFPDVLANHLPMILVALARLGAQAGRLRDWADAYRAVSGLVPVPSPVAPVDRNKWTALLSDRAREADARRFFTAEVARLGIRGTLAIYLAPLAHGVAASALHPLMRLGYGVLENDPAEVGAALGYWACCFLPLPEATGAEPDTDDPGEVLTRVAGLPGMRGQPEHSHLWHAIRATAAEPAFAPVVDWLRVDGTTLPKVAATALALYAATGEFAALHALTGAHWVRLVGSAHAEPRLTRCFWQVVAALVPSLGCPALPSPEALQDWRDRPCPPWGKIKAAAVASEDEHDISLVFSASEEEAVYGDRLYRVVAARRVGLIA